LRTLAQPTFPTLGDSGGIDHVDLYVTYDAGAVPPLAVLVQDDDQSIIYASNEVVLVATEACQFTLDGFDVPELSLTNGQTFWWFRQVEPPQGTLFPGFEVVGIPSGTFSGPLSLAVVALEGPGGFFIWQDLQVGGIDLKVDSRNGLDGNDKVPVLASGHDHYNWGFTAAGVYCVTFRVEGTLAAGGTLSSLATTFVFHVQPLGVVTPFALWQKVHWLQGTAALTNGPWADPENDGLCNALEYASQLDPISFTTNNRPAFSFVTNGPNVYGAWTFRRIKSVPDLLYEPAATSLLSSPTWEVLTNPVSLIDEGEMETVTLRDHRVLGTTPTRFLQHRVRLIQP
jgi:surface-anchored protein